MSGRATRVATAERARGGNGPFRVLLGLGVLLRLATWYGTCCLAMAIVYRLVAAPGGAVAASHPNLLPGVVLLTLVIIGAVRGTWTLARTARRSYALARELRRRGRALPSRVAALARPFAVADRVSVVREARPCAFTCGMLRPRIVLSDGLLAALDDAELRAVLAHEAEHLGNRDPLRAVATFVVPAADFYLPLLRRLRARHDERRELAADRAAVRAGGAAPLAAALLTVSSGPTWAASSVVGMSSPEDGRSPSGRGGPHPGEGATVLASRVEQLESGRPPSSRVGSLGVPALVGNAVLATGFAGLVLWSAAIVSATPLPCCPEAF